jgi:hypothetical protein
MMTAEETKKLTDLMNKVEDFLFDFVSSGGNDRTPLNELNSMLQNWNHESEGLLQTVALIRCSYRARGELSDWKSCLDKARKAFPKDEDMFVGLPK